MLTAQPKYRIASIDILRGLVMLVMALDHTRDFFHQPAVAANPLDLQTTTPILFFTRWITHFCAPIFVFLSGTSAYLSGTRKSKKQLSLFLIKRGLWLVLVEVLIVTFGITFNPLYSFIILQVIWAIGWSMVVLGLLVWLPLPVITALGALLVAGHNLTDRVLVSTADNPLLKILLTSGGAVFQLNQNHFVFDAYAILPWTGIMLLGYGLGYYFKQEIVPEKRMKLLIGTGLSIIAIFVLLRFSNVYGDPFRWQSQRSGLYTFLSFINTTKYPPSLLYTCMTIGPAMLLLALFEKLSNQATSILSVYGRVPFFYYLLHFYLLHILLVILFFASGYTTGQIVDPATPILFRPTTFGFSLPIVYIIWLSVIAFLYLPCRWYDRYKQTHRQWWLSYL